MEKNLLMRPILEGMERTDGCPLCYLWLKEEREILKRLLTDEVAMNPKFMDEVVEVRGFCNRHMHLFYETAFRSYVEDGFGYALYMRAVIERIVEQFLSLYPRFMKETSGNRFLIQLRKALRKKVLSAKHSRTLLKLNAHVQYVSISDLVMMCI